ncbi:hypothetical protein MSAN_01193100 [Mycena sanguinolenta]|uniref:Uncharacterized protein n=1 Tax=Mycena sanguinolenta TaxID=230812 RepID=A0A8H6YI58_9AGAR|nr:hypothetical protein MSAN_01193100 [Mycena sanguinolenta]
MTTPPTTLTAATAVATTHSTPDTTGEDSDVDPSRSRDQSPEPSGRLGNPTSPAKPLRQMPQPPQPPSMPSETRFLARAPQGRGRNPHRKARKYEEILAGPEDLIAEVTFQRNTGAFDAPVIDCEIALANVVDEFVDTMTHSPEEWALVSFHHGGTSHFEAWGLRELKNAVTNTLAGGRMADPEEFELIALTAKDTKSTGPYGSPFVMAARIADPETCERLCAIGTYPVDDDLTFAIVPLDMSRRTWTIGIWRSSNDDGNDRTAARFRWSIAEKILTDASIAKAVERATGGTDNRPIFSRLLDLARTVDVRYNRHSGHWVAYAEPSTTDSRKWEGIRAAIREKRLIHSAGMVSFTPIESGRGIEAPWCHCCKNDDHVHFGCPFPLDDPDNYWGNRSTSLKNIKTGILAKKTGKQSSRAAGPERGSRPGNGPKRRGAGRGEGHSRRGGRR